MTTFKLTYWFKDAHLQRVYVNAADGTSAYIERRQIVTPRVGDSAYDQHRISKGDTHDARDVMTDTVPAHVSAAMHAALAKTGLCDVSALGGDDVGRFVAIAGFVKATGFMGRFQGDEGEAKEGGGDLHL